jgi:hypothetical protein
MTDVNQFDRDLELELHRVLDPLVAGALPSQRSRPQARAVPRVLGGVGAAFAAKAVTGIAIAALAAGAAGAVTEAVVTHSLDPAAWSRQVKQQLHMSTPTPSPGAQHRGVQTSPPTGGPGGTPGRSPNPVLPGVTPLPTITPRPIVTPLPTPVLPSANPTCLPVNVLGC